MSGMAGFLKELFRLTRFEHAIMLALATLIAETVVLGTIPPLTAMIALSLLVPVFSEMGSFALNDYLDIEADRLNRRMERPLVKGSIKPGFALWFSIICLALSMALAYPINTAAFIIAVAFNILAITYNWKLKDLPLVGNVSIALTMAIPFVFGNFVVSPALSPIALALAMLGFVAGLAREIVKSAQDMKGDKAARGSKTLPILIGMKASLAIASALYLLFIPLSAAPFMLGLRPATLPILLIAAADALILAIVYRLLASPEESFGFARNMSLLAFGLGMAGILLAAI